MSECHELCPARMGFECICFEISAEAWEEGYKAGYSDGYNDDLDTVNPYRQGEN